VVVVEVGGGVGGAGVGGGVGPTGISMTKKVSCDLSEMLVLSVALMWVILFQMSHVTHVGSALPTNIREANTDGLRLI
jgi:hypothetical protein